MPYRSRSPLRQTHLSERISRQIAGFGRYAHKRPHGLHVDSNGALRLDDLMRTWGRNEGFKEHEVLDAVRRHMFHDSGVGGSALRFAIDTDSSGRIIIRVMPKKTAGGSEPMTPRESPGRAPTPLPRPAPPQLVTRTLHGSVLQQVAQGIAQPKAAPEALKSGYIPVNTPDGPGAGTAGSGDRMDVDSGPAIGEQRANVQRACEQMGLTAETSHIRQAPQSSASARDDESRLSDRGRGSGRRCRRGDGRSAGEKVSRWLSWALHHGHRELMLDVDAQGFAALEALAAAMRRARSDFGDFGAQRLRALLEETDDAGRFEISGGRLRKVSRDRRQPRPERLAPAPQSSASGRGRTQDDSYGRGRSPRSLSSSACSIRRRRSPSRSASPVAAASADTASCQPAEGGTGKPPPPPALPAGGDGWTKYQDDGRDWWYYEGPLGRWWCEQGSADLQRYED